MAGIVWTTDARREFDGVLATIRKEAGLSAAQKWQRRFAKAVAQIAAFPELGSPVEEYPWRDYREQFVGPYRMIYRFDSTNCRILSVTRGEQRLPRRLDEPAGDE